MSETLLVGQPDDESGENDDLVTRFTYTLAGLLETEIDPLGNVTEYEYDPLGRVFRITLARGTQFEATRQFEYDQGGNQTAVIDENGQRTETDYDALNRPTRTRDAATNETQSEYDFAGRLHTTVDARGNLTVFERDEAGRAVRRIDPDPDRPAGPLTSPITVMDFDEGGNLILIVDPLGNETRFRYDSRGRRIEILDSEGGLTRFEYEEQPNLLPNTCDCAPTPLPDFPIAMVDPAGNRTEFEYDERGRLLREIDPQGSALVWEYDALDRLIRRIDRNGRERHFSYDVRDQVVRELWLDSAESVVNTIQYTYDPTGKLTAVEDAFSSLSFDYDARRRLISVSNAGTPGAPLVELAFQHDAAENVVAVTETIDGQPGGELRYVYDAVNRVEQVTQFGPGVRPKRVDFAYNEVSRFDTITRFFDLAGTQVVARSEYEYDNLNRTTALRHFDGGGDLLAFYELTWDDASRIAQIVDIDGTRTFDYDRTNQLTSAEHSDPGLPDEAFAYDANGNRTGGGNVVGAGNRLLSDGVFSYEYDDEGDLVLRTETATGEEREFSYDHRNRLVRVIDRDAAGAEVQRVEFTYDALNHRIAKRVVTPTSDVLTHFVYLIPAVGDLDVNTDPVLLEFVDDDGPDGPNPPALALRYLPGPAVDQVLAQDDAINDETYWLLRDYLGSTRDLAVYDPMTGETTIVNHIVFDAFGNVLTQTNPAFTTRYLFTGREFDAELNLYYDAATGRFLNEDTVRFNAGDANLYRYVGNAPIGYNDPTGEFLFDILYALLRLYNRTYKNCVGPAFEALKAGTITEDQFQATQEICRDATETPLPLPCGSGVEAALIAIALLWTHRFLNSSRRRGYAHPQSEADLTTHDEE